MNKIFYYLQLIPVFGFVLTHFLQFILPLNKYSVVQGNDHLLHGMYQGICISVFLFILKII